MITKYSALTSRLLSVKSILVLVLMAISISGCGGGGGSAVPSAKPAGYYNMGSATIKDPSNATQDLVLSDLQGMISGNRFMMMSPGSVILYDGTITGITGNDFTATVKIYHTMNVAFNVTPPVPIDTTITGTITEGSTITGTIAGTGIGTGNFSLTFSPTNSTAADLANVFHSWGGLNNGSTLNGLSQIRFDFRIIDASGAIDIGVFQAADTGIFEPCQMTGAIAPVASTAVFTLDLNLTNCVGLATNNGNYTGFATTTDSSHSSLVIMFSNGTVSGMSVLPVQP